MAYEGVDIGPFQELVEVGWGGSGWVIIDMEWPGGSASRSGNPAFLNHRMRLLEYEQEVWTDPRQTIAKWLGPLGYWDIPVFGVDIWDDVLSEWGDVAYFHRQPSEGRPSEWGYPISYRLDLKRLAELAERKKLKSAAPPPAEGEPEPEYQAPKQITIELECRWEKLSDAPPPPAYFDLTVRRLRGGRWAGARSSAVQDSYIDGAWTTQTENYLSSHENSKEPMPLYMVPPPENAEPDTPPTPGPKVAKRRVPFTIEGGPPALVMTLKFDLTTGELTDPDSLPGEDQS